MKIWVIPSYLVHFLLPLSSEGSRKAVKVKVKIVGIIRHVILNVEGDSGANQQNKNVKFFFPIKICAHGESHNPEGTIMQSTLIVPEGSESWRI